MATSLESDNKETLNHRRHLPPGLEIDTTSKTNAFFSMTDNLSTPRPPPALSRKISVRQSIPKNTNDDEQDNLYHYDSYASRLRNLVARQSQSPVFDSLPTPLPPTTSSSTSNSSAFLFPELKFDADLVGKQIDNFHVCKLLGVGAFSKVYLVQHLCTSNLFAMKTINKQALEKDPRVKSSIEREISILKHIDHPNIVHLETTMETENMICIVLEYVEGGELFDMVKVMHKSTLDEDLVKKLFLQLVHAVKWLHEKNIVHRDLKLENILIQPQNTLKITDFGLAREIDPSNPLLVTPCGSEEYAAPEIVQQKMYDGRKSDAWSLGIILYGLLCGYLPFRYDPRKHERVSQLFYRILCADIKWPKDIQISNEAKFVVQSLLERDPEKRISVAQIETLPWFA